MSLQKALHEKFSKIHCACKIDSKNLKFSGIFRIILHIFEEEKLPDSIEEYGGRMCVWEGGGRTGHLCE